MIRPRIRCLPATLGTRGGELVALSERLGYRLDGWQKLACNDILATDDADELAAFAAVVLTSRQCGKSLIGELYALHFASQGETVLFTAHRADTARLIHRRLLASLPEEFGAVPSYTNGQEQISFPSGGAILFRTRGSRTGRGFTFSRAIIDEAQVCTREELDAVVPTLRTMPGAQVLYLACAPDARSNAYCDVLFELRERARRGESEALCFLEWSAGALDGEGAEFQADELPEEMLDDEELWRQATPALESGRITLERMRVEREALDASSFAVEYLSVGIWPQGDGAGGGPVSVEAWNDLVDPESQVNPEEPIPELVVGFDMAGDRRVSVCVVGRRADSLLHLDYVGRFEGASAAVKAICAIFEREDADVRSIVCDGEPGNMDLLARLAREYVSERALRSEGAAKVGVQACGALIDLVAEGKFRHRDQRELVEAIRGAVVKTFSDSWVYSRSRSRSDVSPLLAAAAALWLADLELDVAGATAIHIY